jgi:serine/threonine protein kinase
VIGILLGYIPHKYHNLRALLAGIKASTISPDEGTQFLRTKWAAQIQVTLRGLHNLGILRRNIKTDNVLINDDGDVVVLDFGGGNTIGWVDQDKYGTMEGDQEVLQKIMVAIEVDVYTRHKHRNTGIVMVDQSFLLSLAWIYSRCFAVHSPDSFCQNNFAGHVGLTP